MRQKTPPQKVKAPNARADTRPDRTHDQLRGVAGRNFGYWQADGATRTAAKRSKRP